MQGSLGIAPNLTRWSEQDFQTAKRLTAEYKSIRMTVQQGLLYRLFRHAMAVHTLPRQVRFARPSRAVCVPALEQHALSLSPHSPERPSTRRHGIDCAWWPGNRKTTRGGGERRLLASEGIELMLKGTSRLPPWSWTVWRRSLLGACIKSYI